VFTIVNNYYSKVICSEGGTLNIWLLIPSGMTPQDNTPELKWSVLKVLTAKTAVMAVLKWSVRKVLTAQGIVPVQYSWKRNPRESLMIL
jgi:hypothetical protein